MRLLADFGEWCRLSWHHALISLGGQQDQGIDNANAAGVVAEGPGEEADGDVRVQAEIDRFPLAGERRWPVPAPAPEVTPTVRNPHGAEKNGGLTERHVIGDRHIRSGAVTLTLTLTATPTSGCQACRSGPGHGVEQRCIAHGPSVGDGGGGRFV
ncbi:MAG: hypothetical protein Ct9H300mP1_25070 [Planctomycetaceae bacterium]|nr:MAG: hypothetical protein Ct9H300mP1_25070 [Planctomycetaceae bacterium]